VKQCLHEGFSSVMMDASMYSLEENIRITKAMVELAQVYNASVEAEVGDMGAVDQTGNPAHTLLDNLRDWNHKTVLNNQHLSR
jgi:fructose/tagatose bisphosphate aldolase